MAQTKQEIIKLIDRLAGLKKDRKFSPFIDFIQFPRYRNFEKDLRVNFDFPVTVLVGQYGTGKSSLLQAMYGAPENLTPGQWWFGTAIDPTEASETEIDQTRKKLSSLDKASFWYQYQIDGDIRQAVKMRIRRSGDPDYWEPSRPIQRFGMRLNEGKRRDPTVKMSAVYINFKTQISAFDRCFYFNAPEAIQKVEKSGYWEQVLKSGKARSPRIQDYLRWRSIKLRSVMFEGKTIRFGKTNFHKPRETLTQLELDDIGNIIGRKYQSGCLVEHRFYETWGMSVLFTTPERTYSDAFAGSGESAVVRLVHEVHKSENGRLLLLDEPETSLHPGAQERLLHFILEQTDKKKLQVVISTHSPVFVRMLPKSAIRLMTLNSSGTVSIAENVNPDEAFYVIGHPPENVIQIIVEDLLTKNLLDAILRATKEAFRSQFMIDYRPGGESAMKQDASLFMLDPSTRRCLLFDGDKSDSISCFGLDKIKVTDSCETIDEAIKKHFGVTISFRQDSNMADDKKRITRIDFIKYANKSFRALPFQAPEEAIWSNERAKQQMVALAINPQEFRIIENAASYKEKFRILTELVQDGFNISGNDIGTVHRMFITAFCKEQNEVFKKTVSLLEDIASHA